MTKEDLRKINAVDTKAFLKSLVFEEHERNNRVGLNGFKLTWEELSKDTEGLEEEILEIMKHPKKYKALNMMFAYIRNTCNLSKVESEE